MKEQTLTSRRYELWPSVQRAHSDRSVHRALKHTPTRVCSSMWTQLAGQVAEQVAGQVRVRLESCLLTRPRSTYSPPRKQKP